MSEYMWGVTYDRPTREVARKMDRIAREEAGPMGGFNEVNVRAGSCPSVNGGRYQGWFVGPNRGEPFDRELAARVAKRLKIEARLREED